MAYMIYRSENGSSFGIDTVFLGYKDKDNSFKTKEIAQTRWNARVVDAKLENNVVTFTIETEGKNFTISQPAEEIENLEAMSNLSDAEKTILEMYRKNQSVYKDQSNSRVWHGSLES